MQNLQRDKNRFMNGMEQKIKEKSGKVDEKSSAKRNQRFVKTHKLHRTCTEYGEKDWRITLKNINIGGKKAKYYERDKK